MLRNFTNDADYEAWMDSVQCNGSTQSIIEEAANQQSAYSLPSAKPLTDSDLLRCLSSRWGYSSFRKNQLEICRALLSGRDCFYMTATGSGKSLTYQLPAVALHDSGVRACALIVSPLVSLIEDQVSALLAMGVKACAIGSQSSPQFERLAMDGEFTLVYCTPEKLATWSRGIDNLRRRACLVCCAVDESHCISEWGEGFRPEYRNLGQLRALLGEDVPIIALTASATHRIEDDIIGNLKLREPLRVRTSVNRSNLHYTVREKQSVNDVVRVVLEYRKRQLAEQSKCTDDVSLMREREGFAPMLVYTLARKTTEEIARALTQCSLLPGLVVAYYHAGMTPSQRSAVHEAFIANKLHVVVATNAFGMGIDKANIRLVVHFGLPLSVETYYQQTGRAGRDGKPSLCVLFWNRNDELLCRNLANDVPQRKDGNENGNEQSDGINSAKAYARGDEGCRRKFVLRFFGENTESLPLPAERCCDLCDTALADQSKAQCVTQSVDIRREVYWLLRAVHDLGRVVYGATLPVSVLRGKHDNSTAPFVSLSVFGVGKTHSERWWKSLMYQLAEIDGMLSVNSVKAVCGRYRYNCFQLTERAMQCLHELGEESTESISKYAEAIPFSPDVHTFQPNLSREMIDEINRELDEKRSAQVVHQSLQTIQRRHTAPSAPSSSRVIHTFEKLQAATEQQAQLLLRQKKAKELLRRKQRELATLHGVNPYFVLSHSDLQAMIQNIVTEELVFGGSPGTNVLADRIITLLEWKEWKSEYAQHFAELLHTEFNLTVEKEETPPINDGFNTEGMDTATSSASQVIVKEEPIERSPPTIQRSTSVKLYRPDYTRLPLCIESLPINLSTADPPAEETVVTEQPPPSAMDDPPSLQITRPTASLTSAAKAHRKRQLMNGLEGFKARKK